MTNFEKIKEFHTAFNAPMYETPAVPSFDRVLLRYRLVAEEYKEFKDELDPYIKSGGHDEINLQNLAKEMADVLVVVYGTAIEFGIDLDRVFDDVHKSNMSKLGDDGKPVYREDGKILKSHNYRPPNLDYL